jgi:hypothetical protein
MKVGVSSFSPSIFLGERRLGRHWSSSDQLVLNWMRGNIVPQYFPYITASNPRLTFRRLQIEKYSQISPVENFPKDLSRST